MVELPRKSLRNPKKTPTNSPLPEGTAKASAVRSMFDAIAPRYDLVNRLMTFGLDRRWRRKAVRELKLPAGSRVLDLACGTGDLCRDLNAAGFNPIGFDLSAGMLHAGGNAGTTAPLVLSDVLQLPVPDGSADGITCGFALRNVVDLNGLFAELARVVRIGGRVSLLEVAVPPNPMLRVGHQVYFGKVVPRIGGLLSDRAAYEYLPKSMAYLPPTEQMLDLLASQGFSAVEHTLLTGGLSQLITATRTTQTVSPGRVSPGNGSQPV